MLAECKVEIEATRALTLETVRKRDRGEDVTIEVSLKYLATEMCCRVADRIVQVFGGQGYVKEAGHRAVLPGRSRRPHLRRHESDPSPQHRLAPVALMVARSGRNHSNDEGSA
jgi:alkylation response protein AidB-like acyl-CoA dehydrogenase